MIGEFIIRYMPDVELNAHAIAWTTGDGLIARADAIDDERHVLAGEELQRLAAGRAQMQDHHIRRGIFQLAHRGDDGLRRNIRRVAGQFGIDNEVGFRRGAAEQHDTPLTIALADRKIMVQYPAGVSADDARATMSARPTGAVVVERQTGTQGRLQQGLAAFNRKLLSGGLDGNL